MNKKNYKLIALIGAIFVIVAAVMFNISAEKNTEAYQAKVTYICKELKTVHANTGISVNLLVGDCEKEMIAERLASDLATVRKLKKEHDEMSVSFSLRDEKAKISELLEKEEAVLEKMWKYCHEANIPNRTIDDSMLVENAQKVDALCQEIKVNPSFKELTELHGGAYTVLMLMNAERGLPTGDFFE